MVICTQKVYSQGLMLYVLLPMVGYTSFFEEKKIVNSLTFCYLPNNFYPSHSRDPARSNWLCNGSQSFSITKAMMPLASSVYIRYINLENCRG
jgi:hypothetical protein